MHARFRDRLGAEFRIRKDANPRYSLRAFASFLGSDHSTLSKIRRGKRPVPASQIRSWGKKLGIPADEAAVYVAAEHLLDEVSVRRESQLRHWTAEALAILEDATHWRIVELSRTPEFQPDCRWIADRAIVSVDAVNIALTRLLRLRIIDGAWADTTNAQTESEFREIALARIREQAAEMSTNGKSSH